MDSFAGKAAVVTGGGSGIGAEIVRRLLVRGANVLALDINAEGLADLASPAVAGAPQGQLCTTVADVTVEEQVAAAVAEAVGTFERLDLVFNVAGKARFGTILDGKAGDWFATVQLVLGGTYFGIRHGGRAIRAAGNGGAIVNVSSINAHVPAFAVSAYSVGKAAVEHLTKNAALELSAFGIRVNTVLPGLIDTPGTAALFANPRILEDFTSRIAVGRPGSPGEVAGPCLYLASEEARYITGTSLVVDGGWEITNYPRLDKHR
jgi:NAD(P)-dependent dehydrogenase (short-subunit alcohol dehydrogenase family)